MNPPVAMVMFRAELRCLHCARSLGTFEAPAWPWHGATLLHVPDQQPVKVADWTRLRCATCSGNVYADDALAHRVYPRFNWNDLDQPRRGRPPKWLVAQRQQLATPGDA